MARPRVADGEDGLQLRGVGRGVTTTHRRRKLVKKCYTGPRTWSVLVNAVINLLVP